MLLTFMYHRVGEGKHTNRADLLRAHLIYLKERYPIVLPGDPILKRKLAICLTFDDASYDFYHHVFPLLKEFHIRAVLGVPTSYILDSTSVAPEERLAVPYTLAMQDGFYDTKAPLCTWEELDEMVRSGLVEVASHSYMHCNLTFDFVDLNREVVTSKRMIEERLHQPVNTFIYPFGRTNMRIQEYVREHYPYAFRIGSALNWDWGNGERALCRVPADQMADRASLLTFPKLASYALKGFVA